MMASPMWRVPHASALRWREWDGEFVVYHELSGDTHRLNAVAGRVLQLLTAEPMTVDMLTVRLAESPGALSPEPEAGSPGPRAESPEPRVESPEPIADLLSRLSDLGLIEPDHAHRSVAFASGPL
jgi:PqqD family protein of HPr-rel-A system